MRRSMAVTVPCEAYAEYGWAEYVPGPWSVFSSALPSPLGSPRGELPRMLAAPVGPGVRRDLSSNFKELRGLCNERHRMRAGPRAPWLFGIIERGDTQELARFVQTVRDNESSRSSASTSCSWCNARLAPQKRDKAAKAAGIRKAKECQLCTNWHCEECCSFFVSLGGGHIEERSTPKWVWKPLEVCGCCHRLFDVHLWRQDAPPRCLRPSSAQLNDIHGELEGGLTIYAGRVAQLEGLAQLGDLEATQERQAFAAGIDLDEEDVRAAREAVDASKAEISKVRADVAAARTQIETCLRRAAQIDIPPPRSRTARQGDPKLREALIRRTKANLMELTHRAMQVELRLNPARRRSESPQLQRRDSGMSTASGAPGEAIAMSLEGLQSLGPRQGALFASPRTGRE